MMSRKNGLYTTLKTRIWFYIPIVLLIGATVGILNYYQETYNDLSQALLQYSLYAFFIGFPLIMIAEIHNAFKVRKYSHTWLGILLTISYSAIGFIAAEIEIVVRKTIFAHEKYHYLEGGWGYLDDILIANTFGFLILWALSNEK